MALSAALVASFLATLLAAGSLAGQSWRDMVVSRQISGEERIDVRVRYGAGEFDVRPSDGSLLYRMELHYDEEVFEPVAEYSRSVLELGVRSIGRDIRIGKNSEGEMHLVLARGVPMDLHLEFGAVRADLDLGGLSLEGLQIQTGAARSRLDISRPNPIVLARAEIKAGAADFTARRLGNLNAQSISVDTGLGDVLLDFSGRWQRNADVDVDLAVGSLELRFPEGLGVRLEKSGFLASMDTEGLMKRGDAYYSAGWEEAEHRIRVNVNAAFGSVRVVWVR